MTSIMIFYIWNSGKDIPPFYYIKPSGDSSQLVVGRLFYSGTHQYSSVCRAACVVARLRFCR